MTNLVQNASTLEHNLTIPKSEYWVVSPVDITSIHFEIRYGDFMGSDDPLVTLARVGRGADVAFHVEVSSLHSREQQQGLIDELNEYLVKRIASMPEDSRFKNSWDYLIYHATQTAANLYGDYHWVLVDPSRPARAEPDLTVIKTGFWQKVKSLWQ